VVWQIRRNRTLRGHPRRRVGAAIGENLEGKAIELGGQYEIIERHGDGLGLAFRTLYEFSLPDDSPDEILFGPLARLVTGHDSATINTFFVGQVGDQVEIDGLELKVNWQLKRELNERWSLGLEGLARSRISPMLVHSKSSSIGLVLSPIMNLLMPKGGLSGRPLVACCSDWRCGFRRDVQVQS
jgi:hypothetical protein